MSQEIRLKAEFKPIHQDKRLDSALKMVFPEYSRSVLQKWLDAGYILVDGAKQDRRYKVKGHETVNLEVTLQASNDWEGEDIPIDIVFEDDEILVLNKPAGLVVHPGAGQASHTLVNGVLHYFPDCQYLPRSGIVHRLDKDTTGIMCVAKTLRAHKHIVDQLATRQMGRFYQAIVHGVFTGSGYVDAPIGRHKTKRTKMAVIENGKSARTHYKIIKQYKQHAHIDLTLDSGRTHQIRVHMLHIKHPIVGDPVYGGRPLFPKGASDDLMEALQSFPRQALHAIELHLSHPATGEKLRFSVPLPQDMQSFLEVLDR